MISKLIHYSHITGEYQCHQFVEHDESDTAPMMSYSTTDEVPSTSANEIACYLDADGNPAKEVNGGTWVIKDDYRGHIYWTPDRVKVQINELGVTPPLDALPFDPGPSLQDVKQERIAEITMQCAQAITAGFESSALGDTHFYPCKITDQVNLAGSAIDSMRSGLPEGWTTPFWCADQNGVWAKRPHTAAQIQAAAADGKAHILAMQARKDSLVDLVSNAATDTAEKVKAITW